MSEKERFAEEFASLSGAGRHLSCKVGKNPRNKPLNRIPAILPYDETRVKLEEAEFGGSDYVNASWIVGPASDREYIVAQVSMAWLSPT